MDLKAFPELEPHSHPGRRLGCDAVRLIDPAVSREAHDRDLVAPRKYASLETNRTALDAAFAAEPARRLVADALGRGFSEVTA